MKPRFSADRIRFMCSQLRDRLWLRPLLVCLLSIAVAFIAKLADDTGLAEFVPNIAQESVETLLSIMAASMLVIATFSVASMLSAYATASSTATPRAFTLVAADDASQNALSTFVGSFIFSIVAITAVKNTFFNAAGLFILFVLTALVFAVVVLTFVRWVDSIARLGRLTTTVTKVEKATASALRRRHENPRLCAMPVRDEMRDQAVYAAQVGYVQHVDIGALQRWAEDADARVAVAALPGTFAAPGRALAYVRAAHGEDESTYAGVSGAFTIGNERTFEDDPRFGLVVLSEIAGRALSPAVNDPGTAITILGSLVRLFALWDESAARDADQGPKYDRVEVPELSVQDMFDDAFTAIARDGAGIVEVAVRLQKSLHALAMSDDAALRDAARQHREAALERARMVLTLPADLAAVQQAAGCESTDDTAHRL